MKPKPLLALNHFTVPCSLLTAVLVSVSWVTAEHYMFKLSDASSSEPLNRASAVFKPCAARPQSRLIAQKKAASLTSRPLYNPKAIQEQQTQKQSTTERYFLQVFFLIRYSLVFMRLRQSLAGIPPGTPWIPATKGFTRIVLAARSRPSFPAGQSSTPRINS